MLDWIALIALGFLLGRTGWKMLPTAIAAGIAYTVLVIILSPSPILTFIFVGPVMLVTFPIGAVLGAIGWYLNKWMNKRSKGGMM